MTVQVKKYLAIIFNQCEFRGVFRTKSNIYDGAKSRQLFSQKISIVHIRLGSKYASSIISFRYKRNTRIFNMALQMKPR